jgi:DNA polymerase III gamma/tau subunit
MREVLYGVISRPKTIDDVSAQDHIVAVLKKTLSSTNVSHYELEKYIQGFTILLC